MNLEQAEALWAKKVGEEFWAHNLYCKDCSYAIDWVPGNPDSTITPRVNPCDEGQKILNKLHNPLTDHNS